ncbi:DMT family transporter [Amorphus orientalis]|uniref:Drug/metabolite transporter (DMT)-like permease n=1 Tax=Amorphus orientalis TaxID=649198 RepID=A0AAE3VNA0_9HYPH|nr:DMT family transporter [Amorphus orientalis]MDQ0315166.1 drug/metabolite transporter (DMT)-like permease [Amorphus orientalis]
MSPNLKDLVPGLTWSLLALGIWSGSLVLTRLGVTTTLNAYDLVALRFSVASVLLLPVIWRYGFAGERLGIAGLAMIVTGYGAPYMLVIAFGLGFASAGAAGAINPGLMAAIVAVVGWRMFGDVMTLRRAVGIATILAGIGLLLAAIYDPSALPGYGLLVASAVLWASYALMIRSAGIPAAQATAIVAVGSAVVYLPVYILALPKGLGDAPLADILLQAGFQGVGVGVIALFAFNRSCERLGSAAGAAMPALIPLTTQALAWLILGEAVSLPQLSAAAVTGVGVALCVLPVRPRACR